MELSRYLTIFFGEITEYIRLFCHEIYSSIVLAAEYRDNEAEHRLYGVFKGLSQVQVSGQKCKHSFNLLQSTDVFPM